ncbi:MAG TPA: DnaB-like helicase C-terminal domain-containing protein [Gemmatimonadaceae bacterium]|nr:DnaB-like helicase C-terminal domain-containing protein [Gemmatimonadaceae bacterium]
MRRSDSTPLARLIQRVDAVADGAPALDTIATGFPSIDRVLGGGFRRGDLIVLGGDVGSGKSALALAVALRMAQDGARVAFFSGEMTTDRLLERALAIEGRVRVDDLRGGALGDSGRASVGAIAVRLRDNVPHFALLPRGGVPALRDEIMRLTDAPSVVIIDVIPALAVSSRPLNEELADVVRQLKTLALELSVAIFVTSQVPGLDPARRDRRPTMDDFGAHDSVKEHADVVLAIFREEMYDPGLGIEGATELLVRKNRNGATGYVDLYFYRKWMRFEDMLDPDR